MNRRLQEVINDSDTLIIGIGEEWNWVKKDLKNDRRYYELLRLSEDDEYNWLRPIIEYEYAYFNSNETIENAYRGLKKLIGEKRYFLISDLFLQDALLYGFDPKKSVYPCGNYMYLQTNDLEDDLIKARKSDDFVNLVDEIHDIVIKNNGTINREIKFAKPFLDGKELYINQKRKEYNNLNYNEKEYQEGWEIYKRYLSNTLNSNLLILELGVGLDYPTVIRWPFEKVAFINKKAHFVRVNEKLFHSTAEIKEKTDSIAMNSVNYILQESEGL